VLCYARIESEDARKAILFRSLAFLRVSFLIFSLQNCHDTRSFSCWPFASKGALVSAAAEATVDGG